MAPMLVSIMVRGVGAMPLKRLFSDLFGIACDKDAAIVTHLELFGGSNQWNARKAHDWDVDVFTLFFNLLYSVRVRREGKRQAMVDPL